MIRSIFHLAFPVRDLEEAKKFYVDIFGSKIGREQGTWVDILFLGNQLTLHERPSEVLPDGKQGVRHFGAILLWKDWETLAQNLTLRDVNFKLKPTVSNIGTDAEQAKMLLNDPSGNMIELKAYRNLGAALELEQFSNEAIDGF